MTKQLKMIEMAGCFGLTIGDIKYILQMRSNGQTAKDIRRHTGLKVGVIKQILRELWP